MANNKSNNERKNRNVDNINDEKPNGHSNSTRMRLLIRRLHKSLYLIKTTCPLLNYKQLKGRTGQKCLLSSPEHSLNKAELYATHIHRRGAE